jgi:uncharacterized protein involved in exopolysaccharide biosynthesis
VSTINDLVLSHSFLARVILEFDLYPTMRPTRSTSMPDDVMSRIRQDVSVELENDGRTIDVAYVAQQPLTALKVIERLTSSYLEQSNLVGERSSRAASEFLESQVEEVRVRVLKHAALMRPSADRDPSQAAVQALEHEILQSTYRALLVKREQAAIAMNVEQRHIGETFKLIDPARLPETPIRPNRPLFGCVGAAVGLFLGLAMMLTARTRRLRRPEKVLVQS